MKIVGVTGGICSGKSHVCQVLRAMGAMTIDCDKVAHESYQDRDSIVTRRLAEAFGAQNVLGPDGLVDRGKLGAVVFGNEDKRQQLNGIVWPAVHEIVQKMIAETPRERKVVFVEAALLLEASWGKELCRDGVWVAYCPLDVVLERLMERNGFSREEAQKRIASQRHPDAVAKEGTYVLDTNRPKPVVVEEIKKKYLELIDE